MKWFIFSITSILAYGIWTYNRFVRLQNLIDEAWSGVDVQLKRRSELVPNLVLAVKGYATHEVETLTKVVEQRNAAYKTNPEVEQFAMEKNIGQGIGKLLAIAEAYPDLKAQQNFLELQKALSDTEDQLQYARRYYNGTVRNYQSLLQTFPSLLIGKAGGFQKKEFFEVDRIEERLLPKVQLNG